MTAQGHIRGTAGIQMEIYAQSQALTSSAGHKIGVCQPASILCPRLTRAPRRTWSPAGWWDRQPRARPAASPRRSPSVADPAPKYRCSRLAHAHTPTPTCQTSMGDGKGATNSKSYFASAPYPALQPQALCFPSPFGRLHRSNIGKEFLPPAQVLGGEQPQESRPTGPAWPSSPGRAPSHARSAGIPGHQPLGFGHPPGLIPGLG